MAQQASLHAIVHGRVQGVYFRAYVTEQASRLNLTGFVANLPGGRKVEVLAEGEKAMLEKLAEALKSGPPDARVVRVEANWGEFTGSYRDFITRY